MKNIFKVLCLSLVSVSLFACNSNDNPGTDPIKGVTVFVTYTSGKGSFSDGSYTKTLPIRKGIRWGKRNTSEMPSNPSRGSDFKFNYYTYEDGSLINDATRIDKDLKVVANYSVIAPGEGEGNWDNDTWYQLGENASKGLDKLKKVYNKTTFVGLEKSLKYNNVNYKARVIGENHDTLTNGDKAALTFELTTVINGFVYDNDSSNSNVWSSSLIRDKLNFETLNLFEDGVKESVKSVKKITHKGRVDGESIDPTNIATTNEKVFMLSIKEMGITAPATFPPSLRVLDEGDTYQYYTNASTDKIIKKDNNGNALSYFVRSPSYDSYSWVWGINTSGELGEYDSSTRQRWPYEVSISRAVSLCFAI